VTDPITSQYDEHPLDPNDHSHDNDPSPDLGNTDSPELKVAWDTRPSFNLDPKDIDEQSSGKPAAQQGSDDAEDFKVSFEALAAQVDSMLGKARGLVTQYEALKSKVKASEGSIFGQASVEEASAGYWASSADGTNYWVASDDAGEMQPTVFAKPAREFAAKMNPYQDKALQSIGAALEVVGEYIALVNHSGQVYAATDGHSQFPPPPGKGVTT
jgi:hypothetical protein